MAHQMNLPMDGDRMDQQMMDGQLQNTELRWDETRYAMPQDMGMPQDMSMGQGVQQMPQGWGQSGWRQNWNPGTPIPGMGGTVMPGGQSSAFEQSQRMKNPVDMETTHNPQNSRDAYQASLRSLLARNVGFFIVATFLTGTQRMVTWQGILHTVGSDYIVIYQPDYERYISCDFYALKFVQFHNTKNTPYCASSHTWMAQNT